MANEVNREYKSTLFTFMLSQKEYALQVYNALNNSNYDNPEDITITTLENAVFINRYNDVSYLFNSTLQLYEHQSTYNPNMPLRSLFYLVQTYEKLITNRRKFFGSRLIQIPTPKCIVFYNGTKETEDIVTMKLSDAFTNQKAEGDLELTVHMINVNYGHNKELLDKCEVLRGYSLYISKFHEYNENETISMTDAAIKALDYCVKANVMKDFFTLRRNEVVGMILEEFTTEHVEQYIKEMEEEIVEKDNVIAEKDAEIAELKALLTSRKQA